jgi:hypothetical protein
MRLISLSPYSRQYYYQWKEFPNNIHNHILSDQYLNGSFDINLFVQSMKRLVEDSLILNSHVDDSANGLVWAKNPSVCSVDYFSEVLNNGELLTYISKPFHMERGPLYRFGVIRYSDNKHRLLLIFHHAILNGLAAYNLQHEITNYYNNQNYRSPISITTQEEMLINMFNKLNYAITNQADLYKLFWKRHLAGCEAVSLSFLELKKTGKKPDLCKENLTLTMERLTGIGELRFNFDCKVTKQLEMLKRKYRVTPYIFGQSVFALLIFARTGCRKFCVSYSTSVPECYNPIYGSQINTSATPYNFQKIITIEDLILKPRDFFRSMKENKVKFRDYPISELTKIVGHDIFNISFDQAFVRVHDVNFKNIETTLNHEINIDAFDSVRLWIGQEEKNDKINFSILYGIYHVDRNKLEVFLDQYKNFYTTILNFLLTDKYNDIGIDSVISGVMKGEVNFSDFSEGIFVNSDEKQAIINQLLEVNRHISFSQDFIVKFNHETAYNLEFYKENVSNCALRLEQKKDNVVMAYYNYLERNEKKSFIDAYILRQIIQKSKSLVFAIQMPLRYFYENSEGVINLIKHLSQIIDELNEDIRNIFLCFTNFSVECSTKLIQETINLILNENENNINLIENDVLKFFSSQEAWNNIILLKDESQLLELPKKQRTEMKCSSIPHNSKHRKIFLGVIDSLIMDVNFIFKNAMKKINENFFNGIANSEFDISAKSYLLVDEIYRNFKLSSPHFSEKTILAIQKNVTEEPEATAAMDKLNLLTAISEIYENGSLIAFFFQIKDNLSHVLKNMNINLEFLANKMVKKSLDKISSRLGLMKLTETSSELLSHKDFIAHLLIALERKNDFHQFHQSLPFSSKASITEIEYLFPEIESLLSLESSAYAEIFENWRKSLNKIMYKIQSKIDIEVGMFNHKIDIIVSSLCNRLEHDLCAHSDAGYYEETLSIINTIIKYLNRFVVIGTSNVCDIFQYILKQIPGGKSSDFFNSESKKLFENVNYLNKLCQERSSASYRERVIRVFESVKVNIENEHYFI